MACQDLFRGFLRKRWSQSLEGGTQCHILTFCKSCRLTKKANYKEGEETAKSLQKRKFKPDNIFWGKLVSVFFFMSEKTDKVALEFLFCFLFVVHVPNCHYGKCCERWEGMNWSVLTFIKWDWYNPLSGSGFVDVSLIWRLSCTEICCQEQSVLLEAHKYAQRRLLQRKHEEVDKCFDSHEKNPAGQINALVRQSIS